MNKMEEIDLSDRRGLIAMAYGPSSESIKSSTATLNTTPPKTEPKPIKQNRINEEKDKKKGVLCASSTLCLLFLIAVGACALSALIAFWVTKNAFDRSGDVEPFIPDPRYNMTQQQSLEDIEEEGDDGPSAAELRLPDTLVPLWYNLTVQTYVPGYVDIPKEKNLTFSASVTIKIRVEKATDTVVLNAFELRFPEESSKYRVMVDQSNRLRRAANETEMADMNNNTTELVTDMSVNTTDTTDMMMEMSSTTQEPEPEAAATVEITEAPVTTAPAPQGPVDSGITVVDVKTNNTLEMVHIKLSEQLQAGQEFYLKISYSGDIRESLNGLYQSTYKKPDGTERIIAVTHMESTYARRFVPCFDEPHLKAIWKIKVVHPKGSKATSNAIEEKENVALKGTADWVSTTFSETLPISSYLMAVAVTDFDFAQKETKRGTRFRVWSRASAVNQTSYALEVGTKILELYEDYYNIPFPMQKQDMMALPDFEMGAMENMGLVTYRESALLYDPKVYSLSDKKDVALTVAHELAHQWFGDLVTMKWWDDLWLNEGFATFLEYIGVDAINHEDFRMKEYFTADSQWRAFLKDSRSTSHPLSFKITKAFEVDDAFDSISYDKGASILRMIQKLMGEENFKKGLEGYLKSHVYKNAEAADLWKSLGETAPKEMKAWNGKQFDVVDFADKWTKQMGYPVIEVYRIDPKTVEFTQKRFKMDALTPEKAKYRNAPYWYKWDVPLWMQVDGEEQPMQWLHEAYRMNMTEEQLLIVNHESLGFYRVNYNQRGWEQIQHQLLKDHTKIPVTARARLIDDAFALAESNQLPYEVAFNVTAYMGAETELLPWLSALRGLSHTLRMFGDEPESEGIRVFLQERMDPLFAKIDFNNLNFKEDNQLFESILTSKAVSQYCELRAQNCTEKLATLFKEGLLDVCKEGAIASECSTVPVDIRDAVYCEGVLRGTEAEFERVKNLYQNEHVAVERDRLLYSLGCSRDTYTLKKLLKSAISPNDTLIRTQDAFYVFGQVSDNPVGDKIIFDFIQDHWKEIKEQFGQTSSTMRMIIGQSLQLKGERQIKQLTDFLESHRASTRREEAFKRVLEKARTDTNWLKNNKERLIAYFKDLKNNEKTEL